MWKLRIKKILIEILRFVLGIAPVAVYIIIKREAYFATTKGFSCFLYIAMLICVIALKDTMADALKKNAQFKVCLAILLLAWLFRYVSTELINLAIWGTVGGALAIVPDFFAGEMGKDLEAKRSGEAMAEAFSEEKLKVVKK